MLYPLLIIICLTLLIAPIIFIYNKLIRSRNKMNEAWSIIDVFLRKRHDIVPSLVNMVKGYALHEKKTLEQAIQYRAEAAQTEDKDSLIHLENNLGKSVDRLVTIGEAYPELKAKDNFLKLQRQLSAIENDLEKARRYYNGTVRENNTYLESFPSNIVAKLFNFKKGTFYNQNN